jgi:aspartate carbamoyltransferase catalytic subunit
MSLGGKSLISINDYSKDEWLQVLDLAKKFEKSPNQNILTGKVVACLFFEPSTRTRLSFETAVQRLGGSVIGFSDVNSTSGKKGESLKDTVRVVSKYADLIIIRHPLEGSARLASEYASVPIINAGDGTNQHPTQTLLDLYSIQKTQGTLTGLTVALGGDLRYNRTALTLIRALVSFKTQFIFISPAQLKIPDNLRYFLQKNKTLFEETTKLDAIVNADLLYVNRIKKEYFPDLLEYERVKDKFILTASVLEGTKPNFKVLHALPRINEISEDVDSNSQAYYFEQAYNGFLVRESLISSILGIAS